MDIREITRKKKDGEVLSAKEIAYAVLGYTKDRISDGDMAGWLKAVYDNGMDFSETLALTYAFVTSGEMVDLSEIVGLTVDKHSTGGVGDKTTLVVAPLAAACGLKVAKMSGRSLGHTGGTLDKMESIPGVSVDLTTQEFIDQVNKIGIAIAAASGSLVPADKKIYALRDKTRTVASLPLIASSVMSKKIAAGAEYIVLDVKAGKGAFMKTTEEATELARLCVKLGEAAGRGVTALITDMDQPLGCAVGNVLEVREAIQTLSGRGPQDVLDLAKEIVTLMLIKAGYAANRDNAADIIKDALKSGKAAVKLSELVKTQGGQAVVVREPARLPAPVIYEPVKADADGYIQGMDTEPIGWLAKKAKGLMFEKKIADVVKKGETIAYAFGENQAEAEAFAQALGLLITIGPEEATLPRLIRAVINEPPQSF